MIHRAVCFLLVCLVSAWALQAQSTATLSGRAIDPSGGEVDGADISVLEVNQNVSRHAKTNASGSFLIPLLQPGQYSVTVQKSGFEITEIRNVTLAAGDGVNLTVQMEVGRLRQTVEVGELAPGIQTITSALSTLIPGRAVQDLPVNGRNYVNLVQLTVGASQGLPNSLLSGTRPDDRRPTSSLSVNGQADILNNNIIDGMDNNERIIGTIGARPSIDAIEQIQIQTNLYPAEAGRTPGGVVSIITKSGTNEFHGSAYEFFRNGALDARNFFSTIGPKPGYHQSQYGGSLGGPLQKGKTFFFADYESLRTRQGLSSLVTVPALAERGGDFSLLSTPIIDPATGIQFPHNVIPVTRINPIAANYMSLYPAPNLPGLANNYQSTQNRTQFSHTADARVDHRFTDNNLFFARYTLNDVSTFTPGLLPPVNGIQPGGSQSTYAGPANDWTQNTQLNYLHIFNSALLLELKAGYTRVNIASYPLNYGQNLSSQFGLPGVNLNLATSALTPMVPSGYASVGDGYAVPLKYLDNTFQYSGALSYSWGSHNFKTGTLLIRRQALAYQSLSPVGRYTYNAQPAGDSIASFLLGIPYQTRRLNELVEPNYRTWEPGVYLQDDWRVSRRLTLNLGLRYDVFTPFTEAHNQLSNFDLITGKIIIAGQNGVSDTAGIRTDYGNLAPRLGFALSIGNGFTLRGGYGTTFFPGNYTSAAYLNNPPFTYTYGPVQFVPLSAGLPVPSASDPKNPSGALYAEDPNFRSSYLHQFNLNLQKQLGANVLSAAYIGELGRRLAQLIQNIDLPAPSPLPNPASRAPFVAVVPNVSAIGYVQSEGRSSYNALQLSLQRRFARGLAVNANYTWAHGIDDVSTFSNGYAAGVYLDPAAIATYDRGNSDLDIRHRFVAAVNYEIPWGRSLLFHGWQVNGIYVWQTGLPFTITNGNPQANLGPAIAADRPNVTGSAQLADPTINEWFNTAVFVPQPFGTLGGVGRNTLFGPNQVRLDLSLFKDFPIKESWKLQFRAEVYNVSNTPSFANPNAQLSSPAFGAISSINASSTPRQLQLALKLLF